MQSELKNIYKILIIRVKNALFNFDFTCINDGISLLITEKDWEDIKKMPEHTQLMKDFNKKK